MCFSTSFVGELGVMHAHLNLVADGRFASRRMPGLAVLPV